MVRKYNRMEVNAIFKNCNTVEEVLKVGKVFGFLKVKHGEYIPYYVSLWAHKRYRNLEEL